MRATNNINGYEYRIYIGIFAPAFSRETLSIREKQLGTSRLAQKRVKKLSARAGRAPGEKTFRKYLAN